MRADRPGSPRRVAELADDFPGLPVAGTLGELAATGIDAVVISTPLDTHEALVREVIALGLPVACDKPFTPGAASALTLVEEAERATAPADGLPRRPWYRQLISAPGWYTGYGAKTMPGVREAIEAKRWDEVLCLNRRQIAFGDPDEVLDREVLEATYAGAIVEIPGSDHVGILPAHHH